MCLEPAELSSICHGSDPKLLQFALWMDGLLIRSDIIARILFLGFEVNVIAYQSLFHPMEVDVVIYFGVKCFPVWEVYVPMS